MFSTISTDGVINGCVGCIDGLLVKIRTPQPSETGHVKSYFSGHYQLYGINIQAVCDHNCRFVNVSCAAPGGTNDIRAYQQTPLPNLIEQMPLGLYIVGDNAYVCTDRLLTPFSGKMQYCGEYCSFLFSNVFLCL
jgi:hypothetical protein